MYSFEKLVEEKRKAGDIDWLARELIERMRINVQLVTQVARLGGWQDLQELIHKKK